MSDMHDITPQTIAAIATRLYNQTPQGMPGPSLVPMGGAAQLPNPSQMPNAGQLPTSGQLPGPSQPHMPTGFPGSPPSPTPQALHGLSQGSALPPFPGAAVNPPVSSGVTSLNSGSGMPPNSTSAFSGQSPFGGQSPAHAAHSPTLLPRGFSQGVANGLNFKQSAGTGGSVPGGSGDGLKSFVQQIRTSQLRQEDGSCRAGLPDARGSQTDLLRKMLAVGSPVGSSSVGSAGQGARPFDVQAFRSEFPALHQQVHGHPLVWLDNAATTHKPQAVIDAVSNYYSHDNSNIHRAAHTLAARSTDAYEGARQKVQSFLGAGSVKEIIFVRGATEGINLIAQTWGRKFLGPGDEILLSILEHHANIVPWQMVAKANGAVLKVIPVNDRGEIMLEDYQSLLGPRTKLVALAHANNSLGTILPIAEMIQMAKRYNAKVMIDGAQSVAHIPVNVQELGCDFYAFSGHKIFAPTGIGVVYAREELQELMPPWQGGGNMIKTVTFEETTYSDPPGKFEAGTPSVADAVGLGAALDYLNRIGLPNIEKYEHQLTEYGTSRLSQIDGLRLIGSPREKVGVLSFVLHNRKTEEVGKMLDAQGIAVRSGHHCAQPSLRRFGLEATVRPSLAFYNTHEDIDRLVDAIRKIQRS